MASPTGWIKTRKCLPTDVRLLRLAANLGISMREALGSVVYFWMWADDHIAEGQTLCLSPTMIDAYVSLPGFAQQLTEAGWMRDTGNGLVFVDFEKHNWGAAKRRAVTADRVARHKRKGDHNERGSVTQSVTLVTQPVTLDTPETPTHSVTEVTQPVTLFSTPTTYDPSRGRNSPSTPSCPETDETPVVRPEALLTFPCDGKLKTWDLTQDVVGDLAGAYPSLDILAEARKALAWVQADASRKKTARGMRRFLTAWMGRSQDCGPPRPASPPAPAETLEQRVKRIFAQGGEVRP